MTFSSLWHMYADFIGGSIAPIAEHYAIFLSPILAALFLGIIFFETWLRYIRLRTFLSRKYTLLELTLPKDTFKSPLAMETVLAAIHNTSDGNAFAMYWKGETRPWYSLEIISIEGQVKFIIWTEDGRKKNLMSALYSQYPGVEIRELDDYAKDVQFDPKLWKLWATEFTLTQKEFTNAYPIKTYVDFGLDKDPKEEYKVDPLTHVIEWLGSLRPNEQAWFQFIIRAHKKEQKKSGHFWKTTDKWKDEANAAINKILLRDPKTKVAGEVNPETGFAKLPTITEGERDIVRAIERKLSKLPFDVCVRTVYVAKKEAFDPAFGIGGCISSLKQFNHEHMNGFKPAGNWVAKLDYPWQDYLNTRRNALSNGVLKAYRRRSAFYVPYQKSKVIVLNTEELATMFHLPGTVAATPSLERVPSKKGEAPSNIPT